MISTQNAIIKYGFPTENPNYLTTLRLPFPMRLSWDKNVYVNKIQCHKLVVVQLELILKKILDYYGIEKIKKLQIDMYGGCFNFRKMRGGNDYSRHSWGIAIDLDPERNLLKETSKTARFAREEYKPMIDIFYKHGFVNLGVEKNYDWMHFQVKD